MAKPAITPEDALTLAKQRAGNRTKLAEKLMKLSGGTPSVTPQAVGQWRQCPHMWVLKVEQVTGVLRHELRPDIYPPPAAATKRRKGA